jgi:hypothetical protein
MTRCEKAQIKKFFITRYKAWQRNKADAVAHAKVEAIEQLAEFMGFGVEVSEWRAEIWNGSEE